MATLTRARDRLVPLALAACVLAGCSEGAGSGSTTSDDPARGGTVVVAFNAEMQFFNPLVTTDLNSIEVIDHLLFTPLIQYDESLQPRPHLAESWELTPESVTFRLVRDARWHDGVPVTANDVAFTFERALQPETGSMLASAYLSRVESVEVLDSFTVRFHFTGPHARPLDGFWWAPVPRHRLEDVPPEEMLHAAFNRSPVGSGPFRLVEWAPGDRLVLERVADFPESLGGPARLDRIIFRFVGETTTLLSETLNGRVDVNGSLFPHQAADIEAAAGIRLVDFPSREYYYIGWNTRDPILTDPGVRRALTMAIDRRQLIDAIVFGYGRLATGTIAPWHPSYTEIEPLPFDPEAARQALERAGWRDRDRDGVRENPAGVPLRFTLMTNHENPVRVDIAQVVQAQLAQVGVTADAQTLEWQTLLARHRGRDFQAVVQSWVLDNFRVDPYALFHSSQAERRGSYNRSGLRDARVDSLMEAALATVDEAESRRLWASFALALQNAQPFTFLLWLDELAAVSDRVRGVEMDARGVLQNAADWWIPEDRRRYGRMVVADAPTVTPGEPDGR